MLSLLKMFYDTSAEDKERNSLKTAVDNRKLYVQCIYYVIIKLTNDHGRNFENLIEQIFTKLGVNF